MDSVFCCCQLCHLVLDVDQSTYICERDLVSLKDFLMFALIEQSGTKVSPSVAKVKLVEHLCIEPLHTNAFQEPNAPVKLSSESLVTYPEPPQLKCH